MSVYCGWMIDLSEKPFTLHRSTVHLVVDYLKELGTVNILSNISPERTG